MSQELELDLALCFSPGFQTGQVSEAELNLLSSILPDALKAMAFEIETKQE